MASADLPSLPDNSAEADDSAKADNDWLEIGRIVAPQGLRGEVRVYPSSDFPERFTTPGPRWLQRSPRAEPVPVDLLRGRFVPKKGLYVIQLAQSASRESAEALRNALLLVPSSDRPQLEEGEYHVSDLVGLPVYYPGASQPMGTVIDIRAAGNDILEVTLLPQAGSIVGGRSVLIPFVEAIVPVVDLEQGRIEITPPAGLLDLS
ncbi:MAG: ribosome maturation factor RimM [Cyanobacteria bacterium P01_A01_bin.135]